MIFPAMSVNLKTCWKEAWLFPTNIILPDSLALSVHKRRWIEGIKDKRFDLDEVKNGVSLDVILEEIEKAYLEKALDCTNGKKQEAAELLGISFRTFRYRLQKLEIDKSIASKYPEQTV